MAIIPRTATVVEAGSGTAGTVASITATLPTGINANDFAIVALSCSAAATPTVTTPAGWTLMFTAISSTTGEFFAGYYAFGPSSNPTFTPGANLNRATVITQAWSGVDRNTPFDATVVTTSSGAATTLVCTGITTVTPNAVIVCAGGPNTASKALTTPGGMTLDGVYSASGVGRALGMAEEARPTTGATGTRTWSWDGTSLAVAGFVAALRPGADPIAAMTVDTPLRRTFAQVLQRRGKIQKQRVSDLGVVSGAFGPMGADFDTRLMTKANPQRVRRGRAFAPATAIPAIAPGYLPSRIHDARLLARTALRRGQLPDVPKPQTVAPPPPPPNLVAKSQRVGIPRYVRRKPGESLRTFALNAPVLPLPWDRKLKRARNFRIYGRQFSAPSPITVAPPPWPRPNVRVRIKPPFPRWQRKRFETVPPQFNPPFLPLVLRESRLKNPYPRWRRTRLEFTPNDQAKAPYFGMPAYQPPRPKRGFQARTRFTPVPAQQILPVERKPSRRVGVPNTRRRGMVAPTVEALVPAKTRVAGHPSLAITRRPKSTSVPGQLVLSPGAGAVPARRRTIPPARKVRSQPVSLSPGYTNPVLAPRGRSETPFRAGVALRRGHAATRGAWNDPIAPVFIPKWVRRRRMEGLRVRLGRGQIIAPVIQVVNDVVYTIRPAREAWTFGFTAENWRFDDDNDNWMFWFAGG